LYCPHADSQSSFWPSQPWVMESPRKTS
jgi:hypothetical protein